MTDEVKCPECPPVGAPAWMATFSDLVTLLLTFFVLLLSFAKTETEKYSAALGSVRNAFGGNVLKQGNVIQRGKSPDDSPSMIESQQPIKPFPIEFLTTEGILDKHEINRESSEDLTLMKRDLEDNNLVESADIYEMPEGIKVRMKEAIQFKKGSIKIGDIHIKDFSRMIKLLKGNDWSVFVEGHASRGETAPRSSGKGVHDALILSSMRAAAVTRALVTRGVRSNKITTVFYGDTRPQKNNGKKLSADEQDKLNQRVEFILRKTDLRTPGHKVPSK